MPSVLQLAGCGGRKRPGVATPTAPASVEPGPSIPQPIQVPKDAKTIYSETGWASWYGPLYHKRRAANGEIYDQNQFTAAHRTLPLNSIVRVTNLKSEKSVVVRITDRGPFDPDRVIDLSLASAKAIDVWRQGTARVRLDVLRSPAPLKTGGRWCVQIGAFDDSKTAGRLKDKLMRRYPSAKVLQFTAPTGKHWLRVRLADDDKRRAEDLVRQTSTPEGHVFLVRLD